MYNFFFDSLKSEVVGKSVRCNRPWRTRILKSVKLD